MAIIKIYRRQEGLLLEPGNPLGIRPLEILVRPDILFVNREPGPGVRQWLDFRLSRLGIHPEMVLGYSHAVHSHAEVAQTISSDQADVGIGIAAIAQEFDLDFVPLFDEPYEIVLPLDLLNDGQFAPFFEHLNSGEFCTAIGDLAGYEIVQTCGKVEVIR